MSNKKIGQPKPDDVAQVANISYQIREAIRKALPAPAEQFFTVMIPGKVVNFEDYTGGLDADGKPTTVTRPNSVQLAEAVLCDDMPPLSTIQLGPTGRSVSRSYGATLSKLCPAGSTTGIDDGEGEAQMNEQARRYKRAMDWLISVDPLTPGKKRVELYREKQREYTEAFETKVKAFNAALDLATKDPRNKTVEEQRAAYDKWVSENHKTYRNLCQAAYMDWVTVGKKEETEYWFSIVDNDSAMSRVEASKEAMRNAIISDTDGSVEYQKVTLEPSNWAWLAKQKAISPPSAENLKFSISRLQKINTVIKAMLRTSDTDSKAPANASDQGTLPASGETGTKTPDSGGVTDTNKGNANVTNGAADKAAESYAKALKEYRKNEDAYKQAKASSPDADETKDDNVVGKAKTALVVAKKSVDDERNLLMTQLATIDKNNVAQLQDNTKANMDTLLNARESDLRFQLQSNSGLIAEYQRQLQDLGGGNVGGIQNAIENDAKIGAATNPSEAKVTPDFWTAVKVDISSTSSKSFESASASSYSANAGGSFGLWSVGGSASGTDASADVAKEMASSDVKITFDCMRVDITRSWLRPELFYDHDLKTAPGDANLISPGPVTLASLIDPSSYDAPASVLAMKKEVELPKYDLFPMFPTAFLLAANVVLEITNSSTTIQNHFNESKSTASGSVGYGPFSVSASTSHSDKQLDSNCQAISGGCRITIKSPQIIGWISQMLPALPRPGQ